MKYYPGLSIAAGFYSQHAALTIEQLPVENSHACHTADKFEV